MKRIASNQVFVNPVRAGLIILTLLAFNSAVVKADGPIEVSLDNWKDLEGKVEELAPVISESCVALKSQRGALGSGVIASTSGLIFTCAHTFDSVGEMVVIYRFQKPAGFGRVIKFCKDTDIAVIRFTQKTADDLTVAPIANTEESLYDTTFLAVGHPSGFDANRSAPIRIGFGYTDKKDKKVFSTCTITKGDSGGGLFNVKGELLAVHRTMDSKGSFSSHTSISHILNKWPELKEEIATGSNATKS